MSTTYRPFADQRLTHRHLERRGVDALVSWWRADPAIAASLVASQRLEPVQADRVPLPGGLHPALTAALRQHGLRDLYHHQLASYDAVQRGEHAVIVTPTASGKTLCYNLPILDGLLTDPASRALYLFPTKALARDQLASLLDLAVQGAEQPLAADVYDGDTPEAARSAIRTSGRLVLSNPDMLHAAILPNHTKWISFFQGLRWVVLDELHQYRGVFGSHVANVLRRLMRICRFYGASPSFVCTSATIGNPGELAAALLGAPVTVIDRSGAPLGAREIWLTTPPLENASSGLRASPLALATRLAADAMRAGNPTILFCRGRMETEIALSLIREQVPGVESYRGGYLPSERRSIERRLRDGELPGVVSTNALELGIDIGSLDVAISCGFPGSLASARQQMGRAGRRQSTSLAVLVAGIGPLDQYLVRHPEYFFGRSPEHAVADPDNDLIRASHMRCAAFELPFAAGETFGPADTQEFLDFFAEEQLVHRTPGGEYHWMAEAFPAREVGLRSADGENVVIIDQGPPEHVIGEMDRPSAVTALHDQAIYVHRGQQYHVDRFDYAERKAWVTKVDVEYYTQAQLSVELKVLEVDAIVQQGAGHALQGDVTLSIIPTIFKKLKLHGAENIGAGPIFLPEERMQTAACWFEWRAPTGVAAADLEDGLDGVAYLLRTLVPLYAVCERGDVGSVPKLRAPETGFPTVYLYDQYPGGIGLSERLHAARIPLIASAREVVAACACDAGCPSCVGPSLDPQTRRKSGAARLLACLA